MHQRTFIKQGKSILFSVTLGKIISMYQYDTVVAAINGLKER